MGDATSGPVRLSFNPQLRVEFRGVGGPEGCRGRRASASQDIGGTMVAEVQCRKDREVDRREGTAGQARRESKDVVDADQGCGDVAAGEGVALDPSRASRKCQIGSATRRPVSSVRYVGARANRTPRAFLHATSPCAMPSSAAPRPTA